MKPSDFILQAINLLGSVEEIAKTYDEKFDLLLNFLKWEKPDQDFDQNYEISDECTPKFKKYPSAETVNLDNLTDDIRDNAINNIMRSSVITADRLVSQLSRSELHHAIQDKTLNEYVDNALDVTSNLDNEISAALSSGQYDETRNQKQSEKALELSRKEGIAILAGAAGCGKTKIALEWASLKNAKKIFWICPRVQICQGIFTELTEQYLPDSDVEIYTGEFKFSKKWDNSTQLELSGDIIVTTIDQILNAVTSHTKVDLLVDFLNAHVVFDEYHEYTNMPAFNLLFAELIEVKKLQNNQSTLLVSATPNPYFIDKVLGLSSKHDIVVMPSFNECLYRIEFVSFDESKLDETNPLFTSQSEQTFVISNTAQTAQLSFIRNQANENSILFHSKYKRSDKKRLFNEVYESFKKDGTPQYSILRAGPIVQASLNISSEHMVSEITTPENLLQRLGRLDRFGLNKASVNVLKVAVPKTLMDGKGIGNCARFLSRQHQFLTTRIWLEHLQSNLSTDSFKLQTLYEIYNNFYHIYSKNKDLEKDLLGAISQSIKLINNKVTDPIKIPRKKEETTNTIKISNRSLRGNTVFVQMAKCNLENYGQPEILNEYAYDDPIDDKTPIDNLTASVNEVCGYDKPDKNLVINMYKKHHHIQGGKQSYNDAALIKEARSSDFPIFLSYTPNDLISVGGGSAQHPYAIFYCVCNKQPIGALKLNSLINFEDDSDE